MTRLKLVKTRHWTPEQKQIRELRIALDDMVEEYAPGHHCPYCGTGQCAVSEAQRVLRKKIADYRKEEK